MKILIKVTKEILEKSANCENAVGVNCAIACAIGDLIPNSWTRSADISVYKDASDLYYDMLAPIEERVYKIPYISISLPSNAKYFIKSFDKKMPKDRKCMQPISFEIDVPNELIEKIGIGEVYKILSESKTLEHVN